MTIETTSLDNERLAAEIICLKAEVVTVRRAITNAALALRGELDMRAVNDAILSLNTALPVEEKIDVFMWGTPTLPKIREAVQTLAHLIGTEQSPQKYQPVLGDREYPPVMLYSPFKSRVR